MYPELVEIGFLKVHAYGFFLAAAFLCGIFAAVRQGKKRGIPENQIYDMALYIMAGSLVFARLFFVVLNWKEFSGNPASIFWSGGGIGGLSHHGGLFGGILGAFWFCRKRKLKFSDVADSVAPSLALGTAVARIGCFLNGCCLGIKSSVPWSVVFPGETFHRHPVQLYDTFLNFLLFAFLVFSVRFQKFSGQIVLLYFLGFSVERAFVEFFRKGESAVITEFLGFTQAQFISLFVFLAASVLLFRNYKKRSGSSNSSSGSSASPS